MNNKLKIGFGVAILALLVLIFFRLPVVEETLGTRGSVTYGFWDAVPILSATSSATARSQSFSIGGAKKVTFLIGTQWETFSGGVVETPANTYTFEVADELEPSQLTTVVGTTTTIRTAFLTGQTEIAISTSTLGIATTGTTTVSLELTDRSFPFVRVVRVRGDSEESSTTTVMIIREY